MHQFSGACPQRRPILMRYNTRWWHVQHKLYSAMDRLWPTVRDVHRSVECLLRAMPYMLM